MSTSYAAGQELLEDIGDLFYQDPNVLVTDDPAAAGPQLAAGGSALVLGPPVDTFTTHYMTEHEWTLLAVAGPTHDPRAAWPILADLVEKLREPLDLDMARPAEFNGEGAAGTFAAYLLTFTTTTDN